MLYWACGSTTAVLWGVAGLTGLVMVRPEIVKH